MALEKQILKRVFVIGNDKDAIKLTDPDPDMTPEQVRKFYAGRFPQLVNSTTTGPIYDEDNMVFTFKTGIGTKG